MMSDETKPAAGRLHTGWLASLVLHSVTSHAVADPLTPPWLHLIINPNRRRTGGPRLFGGGVVVLPFFAPLDTSVATHTQPRPATPTHVRWRQQQQQQQQQ